jgi:hypothetical protein
MVTFELRVAVKLPTRLGGSGAEAAARVVEGLSETTEVSGSTPNAAGNEWRQSRRSKKEGVLITFLFRTHSRGPVSLGERRILCVRWRLGTSAIGYGVGEANSGVCSRPRGVMGFSINRVGRRAW